jgi:hypothetical protein
MLSSSSSGALRAVRARAVLSRRASARNASHGPHFNEPSGLLFGESVRPAARMSCPRALTPARTSRRRRARSA